jgi:hypothetical protein
VPSTARGASALAGATAAELRRRLGHHYKRVVAAGSLLHAEATVVEAERALAAVATASR